jgi:hypothetical protein
MFAELYSDTVTIEEGEVVAVAACPGKEGGWSSSLEPAINNLDPDIAGVSVTTKPVERSPPPWKYSGW